jgi:hypothetical protein
MYGSEQAITQRESRVIEIPDGWGSQASLVAGMGPALLFAAVHSIGAGLLMGQSFSFVLFALVWDTPLFRPGSVRCTISARPAWFPVASCSSAMQPRRRARI